VFDGYLCERTCFFGCGGIDAHMCNPGYNVLVHFTISYDNLKTAAIGFATAVATLAQFQ
jgi:hypothetical protein